MSHRTHRPRSPLKSPALSTVALACLLLTSHAAAQSSQDEDELAASFGDRVVLQSPEVSIATGRSQPLRRAPAVASVVTAEDISRIGATDLDEVMGEDAGVTAGEGIGLGNRSVTGIDGPGFELRREVSPIQIRDRQTRRGPSPSDRIEVVREILPRTHRRTPFPEPELTLARPAHAPEEPGRAEVMEERKEHWTRAGGSEDRRAGLARGLVDQRHGGSEGH